MSNEAGAPPPPGSGGGDRRRRRRRRGGGRGPRPEGQETQQAGQAQAGQPQAGQPQAGQSPQQRPQPQSRPQQQRPQQQQRSQQPRPQQQQPQQRPQRPQQPQQQQRPPRREDRPQRPPQAARPQPAPPPPASRNDFDAAWTEDAPVAAAPEPVEVEVQRTPTPPEPVEPRDPDGEDVFRPDGPELAWPQGQLVNLTGVKFRDAGTIYEFDAGDVSYRRGDKVIVETERGPAVGTVAVGSRRASSVEPLRRIVRAANSGDDRQRERNLQKEREALVFCRQKIRERKMSMKLARVEYPLSTSHGGGRVLFYFASEERIDFRDLVKDLATKLHARIEMRQIGARDEAKAVGGIGSCGRELCCSTWLPAFVPISIKMAKDQGLVLNPSKLAGQCGRLKCCLVYEHSTYKEMSKSLPKMGKRVSTPAGDGKVVELDILRQKVRVWFEEGGSQTFPGDVVKQILPPGAQRPEPEPDPEPEQTE